MKSNIATKPDNITAFPGEKKQRKVKELQRATIPAGVRFESKEIIHALDKNGNRMPWKRFFYYNSRLWVIHKQKESASAPWYFCGRIARVGRINKSTNTNLEAQAVSNAVETWLKEDDPTEVKKASKRRSSAAVAADLSCERLFEAYIQCHGFEDWDDANANVQQNIRSARLIIRTLWPGSNESKIKAKQLYAATTVDDFKSAYIKAARKKAIAKHGKENKQAIEYAVAKAQGGAARALQQIKNLLAKERNSLKPKYEQLNVILPQECFDFRELRITGANSAWEKYVPPSDKTVKVTFAEIEKFSNANKFTYQDKINLSDEDLIKAVWSKPMVEVAKDIKVTDRGVRKSCQRRGIPTPPAGFWLSVASGSTPNPCGSMPEEYAEKYKSGEIEYKEWSRTTHKVAFTLSDVRNFQIYLLFWFCVGAGLRTKEIAQLRKDQIRMVNGRMTLEFRGKGNKLAVMTMQNAAAERVQQFLEMDDSDYVLGGNFSYRYNILPNILRKLMRSWGWKTDKLIHQLRAYIGFKIYEKATLEHARVYLRHSTAKITKDFYVDHFKGREVLDVDIGL